MFSGMYQFCGRWYSPTSNFYKYISPSLVFHNRVLGLQDLRERERRCQGIVSINQSSQPWFFWSNVFDRGGVAQRHAENQSDQNQSLKSDSSRPTPPKRSQIDAKVTWDPLSSRVWVNFESVSSHFESLGWDFRSNFWVAFGWLASFHLLMQ